VRPAATMSAYSSRRWQGARRLIRSSLEAGGRIGTAAGGRHSLTLLHFAVIRSVLYSAIFFSWPHLGLQLAPGSGVGRLACITLLRPYQPFADGGPERREPGKAGPDRTQLITVLRSPHSWTVCRQSYTRAFKGPGAGSTMHSPESKPMLHSRDGGPGKYPRALTLPRIRPDHSQSQHLTRHTLGGGPAKEPGHSSCPGAGPATPGPSNPRPGRRAGKSSTQSRNTPTTAHPDGH
jgi:hypothetical protein